MGWFDEQIRQRKQIDNDVFEDSFVHIAGAVMGKKLSSAMKNDRQMTLDAFGDILKYYHLKVREVPDGIKENEEQLEYLLRPHGIMRRKVKLADGWYKDAMGAMLAIKKSDGGIVAITPSGISGYQYIDRKTGQNVHINKHNQFDFEDEAIAFYKPFPLREMKIRDLVGFMFHTLSYLDIFLVVVAIIAVTLLGMCTPYINQVLVSDVLPSGSMMYLASAATFLICIVVTVQVVTSIKELLLSRIHTKLGLTVQSAAMMRILSLPPDFFQEYSAGELSSRVQQIDILCILVANIFLQTGLTALFSLVYITQIFAYAPVLVVPAVVVILTTTIFSIISATMQMNISRKQLNIAAKESGMGFALISGIQKIRLSGSEKRAFARWGRLYAQYAELTYNPPNFIKINSVITTAITLVGTIVIYNSAMINNVSVADYYAFNTAYGMISGAFVSLSGVALTFAKIRPLLELLEPILKACPEVSEGKQVIERLSGGIELNNVSFRYSEDMPLVVDNMSLKIRSGQYVAIVGKTGCGKSTLMRLLLGFETPQKGAVYYDGKDLSKIDLRSLRRKIGVVMQNGKLFQGDIFSNITISAPQLTMDDAWKAAEMAGMAEDIRNMPMGMNTIISEGNGGISGGQRQRIMIARAIAPKPRILMFDEATSALDNMTQKTVSEALDGLKCTRIVIAHRLSTIRQCDRIIVLDKGKIIEDGKYEELIAKKGFFADLVSRQQIDKASD